MALPANRIAHRSETRLKSRREKSTRQGTARAPSRMAATAIAGRRSPVAQPQNSTAAPSRSGGGLTGGRAPPPSAPPRGEGVRLGPDEQEVEQRVLGLDRASDRRRDGDRLLEDVALWTPRKRVEDQRVAHEELALVLPHHRPADPRHAPPVDAAQRVAGAVVAQGREFLRISDGRDESDAATLVLPRPRQCQVRHRVALRQHHERAGEPDPNEAIDEAERIGPRDRDGGEREAAPAQWQELDNHLARVARREGGQRSRRGRRAAPPRDEPSPARIADRPVEPIPALLTGLARAEELVERRARVAEILEQHETALRSRGLVPDHDAVCGGLAGRHETLKDAPDLQAHPEAAARGRADAEERGEEREDLIAHGTIGVKPDHRGGDEGGQRELAGRGELPAEPVLERRGGPEEPVGDPLHAGTGTFFTISSTIPRAVTPEKRACASITSRCARTGTASSWTCSGTTNAPPSRSASAWAAFTSASEARGLAPSCTPGTVRVSRTRSTA